MGHLNIHGSKMSKSLKNFVSIRDALGRGGWTARGLRVVFLMGGWKEGIEVREGVLAEANKWETTVTRFFSNVKALVAEEEARESAGEKIPQLFGDLEHGIHKEYASYIFITKTYINITKQTRHRPRKPSCRSLRQLQHRRSNESHHRLDWRNK